MKEITGISLGRMNNGAHFIFVKNILDRAQADTAVQAQAAAQVAALKAAVEQEDRDLKLSQKSLLTDDIAQADAERDACYLGYKRAVQGFLDFPVADVAKAAKVLAQHIKDYGIDPRMQLDRETGMLVNFIADLEDKYKAEVTKLSLALFVENLKEANARLMAATAERTAERMGQTVGALKASRAASDEAYRMLVKMVNALALVYGEADYADFIDYVNTEVVHYKREVLGQKATSDGTPGGGDENPGGGSETPGGGDEKPGGGSETPGGGSETPGDGDDEFQG